MPLPYEKKVAAAGRLLRLTLHRALRRMIRGPRPGHVYRAWEHGRWGDRIQWLADLEVVGWLDRIPRVNDHILARGRAGELRRYRIVSVRRCGDPRDMFFASLRLVRIEGAA